MKGKKCISILLAILLVCTSLFYGWAPAERVYAAEENTVYVSVNGKEDVAGTKEDPFGSLEAARDFLRKKDLNSDNRGMVYLMEGTYYVESENPTLFLTEEDSYVTYAAYENQEVKICGTATLNNENFKKLSEVSGEQYASAVRLQENMKDKVYVYDLGAENIPVGTIYKNGFNWAKQPFSPELMVDSKIQTLAKYPNSGVMKSDMILAGQEKNKAPGAGSDATKEAYEAGANEGERPRNYIFDKTDTPKTYEEMLIMKGPVFYTKNGLEEQIADWAPPTAEGEPQDNQPEIQSNTDCTKYETDGWLTGYFENNYANDMARIYSVEADKRLIHCKYPSLQGVQDKRIQLIAQNLLCELDMEGEYYIDRYDNHNVLYYYPEGGIIGDKNISLTSSGEPFIQMEGTREIEIKGITFEGSTGYGLILLDAEDCIIRRCEFANISLDGVKIGENNKTMTADPSYTISRGGYRNIVTDCLFHDLGGGGVYLAGGDEQTLEPAYHLVQYCEFYNISRLQTYTPAVYMEGVGSTARYNYIHDAPHMVIQIMGNDMKVLYNRIEDVCQNTSDQGPIYSGRCVNWLGNEIAYNYIANVKSGNYAVYMDDGMSGMRIHHNIFANIEGEAIFSNNGFGHQITDNLFVNTKTAVKYAMFKQSRPIDNEKVLEYRYRRVLLEGDGTNYTNTAENINKWYEHYARIYPYLNKLFFPSVDDKNGFTDKDSALVPSYQVFKNNAMIGKKSRTNSDEVKSFQDAEFLTNLPYIESVSAAGLNLKTGKISTSSPLASEAGFGTAWITDWNENTGYCNSGIRPVTDDSIDSFIPEEPEEPALLMGDVNGDTSIDAQDALEILKYSAKMITLTDEAKERGDVNKDTIIDATDALRVLKFVAHMIDLL